MHIFMLNNKSSAIKVASDLSTDFFINVLRRFIARRGQPDEIFSDNGTNFVGAKRVLSTIGAYKVRITSKSTTIKIE